MNKNELLAKAALGTARRAVNASKSTLPTLVSTISNLSFNDVQGYFSSAQHNNIIEQMVGDNADAHWVLDDTSGFIRIAGIDAALITTGYLSANLIEAGSIGVQQLNFTPATQSTIDSSISSSVSDPAKVSYTTGTNRLAITNNAIGWKNSLGNFETYIGQNGYFHFGNATDYIEWTGTYLTVNAKNDSAIKLGLNDLEITDRSTSNGGSIEFTGCGVLKSQVYSTGSSIYLGGYGSYRPTIITMQAGGYSFGCTDSDGSSASHTTIDVGEMAFTKKYDNENNPSLPFYGSLKVSPYGIQRSYGTALSSSLSWELTGIHHYPTYAATVEKESSEIDTITLTNATSLQINDKVIYAFRCTMTTLALPPYIRTYIFTIDAPYTMGKFLSSNDVTGVVSGYTTSNVAVTGYVYGSSADMGTNEKKIRVIVHSSTGVAPNTLYFNVVCTYQSNTVKWSV